MLGLMAFQARSQQVLAGSDYLKKSKTQTKIGRILLIGGASLMALTFIIPKGDLIEQGLYCGPGAGVLCNEKYRNDDLKSAVFLTGAVSALSSIPFFILAKKNRNRAASIGLKTERTIRLNNQSITYTQFPAFAATISF